MGIYFGPVPLTAALLRGEARFGWALDAVKADKTPLAVASKT